MDTHTHTHTHIHTPAHVPRVNNDYTSLNLYTYYYTTAARGQLAWILFMIGIRFKDSAKSILDVLYTGRDVYVPGSLLVNLNVYFLSYT